MDTESMTPAAGSALPSQRMGKKSGYSKGASPDDVFLSMEYDDALAETLLAVQSPMKQSGSATP